MVPLTQLAADSNSDSLTIGISTVLCRMCKNFKRQTKCGKKSSSSFKGQVNLKCLLPLRFFFKRTGSRLTSDEEICIATAREAFQPIYVTEITKKFPSEILMPFVSAKQELGELNLLGNRRDKYIDDSLLSLDSDENVAEIFAWVYDKETEVNGPDIPSN